MKKSRLIAITLLTVFASAAAVSAQIQLRLPNRSAAGELKDTSETQIKLLPKTEPPPVKSKKKGKKPAPKPVSEYKFERIDHKPAYTFDKKTNPIIKEPKPKKSAAKKAGPGKNNAPGRKAAPAPRTQPAGGAGQDDGMLKFPEEDTHAPPKDQPEE